MMCYFVRDERATGMRNETLKVRGRGTVHSRLGGESSRG